MFTGILHTDIDSVWQEALPWVEMACAASSGRYIADDFRDLLKKRAMQLWVWRDETEISACCITSIANYPRKKYAQILIGTGRNRNDWQNCVSVLEAWAESNGCDGIESIMREGWWRAFYKLLTGWEKSIFIEKEF